jgi:putative nucleotidyltransferase with HDIG domain
VKAVESLISRVDEFPTLPTIYATLSDVMANPRSTAADVANVISQDQSSASKVLKTANSPIYGFLGKISTITQAIVYIGFEEVKNLIMALSIINLFSKIKPTDNLNPIDLWKHSIGVGVVTRFLGGTIGIKKLEDFFVAGILHDIGKLIFFKYIPDEYSKAVNYALENNLTAKEAEQEILGISHTVIGDMLAEKWRLPKSIRNAIAYHYSGRVGGEIDPLVACIHLADATACLLELGAAGDDMVPEINFDVWDYLKLPENIFTKSYSRLMQDYQACVDSLLKS